jgi:uncharacterized protein (TIGR02677 family)
MRALTDLFSDEDVATGSLQIIVVDAIADRLADLHQTLTEPNPDGRVYIALMELEAHLESFQRNVRQYAGQLQRLLRAEDTTDHQVKAATISYLQDFLTGIEERESAMRASLLRIESTGLEQLWSRARSGAGLAPTADADWLAGRRIRWGSLRSWFVPTNGVPARVDQLRVMVKQAIVTLLDIVDRRAQFQRAVVNAAGDYRSLARWFSLSPNEKSMHELYSAAFGLGSARHAHLTYDDPELIVDGVPWTQAGGIAVAAPVSEFSSGAEKVRDVSAVKKERSAKAAAERAQQEKLWHTIATSDIIELSEFDGIDQAQVGRIVELLGRALAVRADHEGNRHATTSDGKVEVIVYPPLDDGIATLRGERGLFRSPNYRISVRVIGKRIA